MSLYDFGLEVIMTATWAAFILMGLAWYYDVTLESLLRCI